MLKTMQKKYIGIILVICLYLLPACKKDWLERQPKNILLEEQVWNDPKQIVALLANFYDRLPVQSGLQDINNSGADGRIAQWRDMANIDDAMWSGQSNEDWRNNIPSYGYDSWR